MVNINELEEDVNQVISVIERCPKKPKVKFKESPPFQSQHSNSLIRQKWYMDYTVPSSFVKWNETDQNTSFPQILGQKPGRAPSSRQVDGRLAPPVTKGAPKATPKAGDSISAIEAVNNSFED